METVDVRHAAVAGQFYPDSPEELQEMVTGFIQDSAVSPAPDQTVAIIVPHAGYIYSGPTAGYGYARVQGKRPQRVILMGCSHRALIPTASIYTHGAFETPVGSFPIDEIFAHKLAKMTGFFPSDPHLLEHSLEVQLPFLHVVTGQVPIVPILFGSVFKPWHENFIQRLLDITDETDLVIASTDLSHYLSDEQARIIDHRTIDLILSGDWKKLNDALHRGTASACGGTAVLATMIYANSRNATIRTLLDYRNSGATSGDMSRVVGYAAISLERAS